MIVEEGWISQEEGARWVDQKGRSSYQNEGVSQS